jgi:serine/threonine protein kinase
VTHFDLKPGNILVDNNGHLKISLCFSCYFYLISIADYGESRLFLLQTHTQQDTIGTFMYMAPELLDDIDEKFNVIYFYYFMIFNWTRKYRFECDIWSLAMILFELMESEHPYDGDLPKVVLKVRDKKVKPLTSKRPQELVELYNSMRDIVCFVIY